MKKSIIEKRGNLVAGLGLVVLGLLFLVAQITNWGLFGFLILPLMALFFIAWGILTRTSGLLIPGGILAGISLGIGLMALPLASQVENAEGGLFMLGFAAGWVLIPILSTIFTRDTHWWALIPAAIMGVIGLGLVSGGIWLELLGAVNYLWPVILIAIGVYLLLRRGEKAA